jgi:tetraacyldisaccharide 4'-kinase
MLLLRWLLFPISIIFWLIGIVRNALYDNKLLASSSPEIPSICIGNLRVGGTGKSPMTNYLVTLLKLDHSITILSRGYGRKTTGFHLVKQTDSSLDVGDEPLAYKLEHLDSIQVAVSENRLKGIMKLLPFPANAVLLLDDAFQHRQIKAGLNILLSTFDAPFYNDFLLPTGNLREAKSGANRADILVITKCPNDITQEQKDAVTKKLAKYQKKIFFSKISYAPLVPISKLVVTNIEKVMIVSGIANPIEMQNHLASLYTTDHINFPDHHEFSQKDIDLIHKKFDTFANKNTIIVTTHKDFMRLKNVLSELQLENYPWYILPMTVTIENENEFNQLIRNYARKI